MEPNEILLRRRGYGEGMPLILSNGWNLKEDVIPRLIVESLGTSQFKIGDLNKELNTLSQDNLIKFMARYEIIAS